MKQGIFNVQLSTLSNTIYIWFENKIFYPFINNDIYIKFYIFFIFLFQDRKKRLIKHYMLYLHLKKDYL